MSETTTTKTTGVDDEYEHLATKRREQDGTVEVARVETVYVGENTVALTLGFEWTTDTERITYDLDDERDVLKLEALAETHGLDFEQLGHLEGLTLDVEYTGSQWLPKAHLAQVEGEGSALETFRTELRLLVRSVARSPRFLRGAVERLRGVGSNDLVIGAIVFKKVIIALGIAAIFAWLIL